MKHILLLSVVITILSVAVNSGMGLKPKEGPSFTNDIVELLMEERDTVAWFNKAIPFVLKHEGDKFVNDTAINEVSRRGITFSTYKRHYGRGTWNSIVNLTEDEATEIYKSLFWDENNLDSITSLGFVSTAIVLMDSEINLGSYRANKFFQDIIGVPREDRNGKIDEKTLMVLKDTKMSDKEVYKKLIAYRRNYYSRLVKKREVFSKYHKGWNNRLDAMLAYVEEM